MAVVRLLDHPPKAVVGLITAAPNRARQSIETAADGRCLIIDEDRGCPLDPHLIYWVGCYVGQSGGYSVFVGSLGSQSGSTSSTRYVGGGEGREGRYSLADIGKGFLRRVVDHVRPRVMERNSG